MSSFIKKETLKQTTNKWTLQQTIKMYKLNKQLLKIDIKNLGFSDFVKALISVLNKHATKSENT